MVKMIQDKRNESAGYSKWIKCDENAEEEEEAEAEEEKQQRQTKLGFCIFFCLRIHYACMLGVLGVCVCVCVMAVGSRHKTKFKHQNRIW